jgi:hypothetical protein
VQLVYHDAVRVEAVLGACIRRDRTVDRAQERHVERLLEHLGALAQLRARLDHRARQIEDDRGLLAVGRRREPCAPGSRSAKVR